MLKIAYSDVYKYDLPQGHRFPMIKYELLPEQLLYEGTVSKDNFFEPGKLTHDQLLTTHTATYLDKLNNLNLNRKEIRNIGFPVLKSLIERGKIISSGTYECAMYALQYGVSMNIAGGTHHSYADRGEGFCIYNDMALASNLLMSSAQVKQVLFIDLDVHQGNGNAHIFRDSPSVYTFSMHGANNYPLRKEKSDMDIGVPDKIEDDAYLAILKRTLPYLFDTVQPEVVFYLAGVDVLESDKLGRLKLTKKGCSARDKMVLDLCKLNSVPVVVTMGGGYSERLADIIDAHANTYRIAQSIFF